MISQIGARLRYVAAALATIGIGLWIHLGTPALGAETRDILGDALWAAMMTWWVAAIAPRISLGIRGVMAYGICAAVEVSQLVHTPNIDAVRATTLGHLVLGSGFDPRDLVSYAAGVAVALLIESIALKSVRTRRFT